MKFIRLLAVPFALLFVLFIRKCKKRIHVRIGEIWDARLGHLLGNTECYLCEMKERPIPGTFDIWYPVTGRPSNKVIYKKYKKILHTMPHWFGSVVAQVNKLWPGWEAHAVSWPNFDRDIHNLWAKYAPHIGFTEWEYFKGERLLKNLGIPKGAKWVCLFIRDSAYLKQKMPWIDWSYHDYRDSDISACIPAVQALVDRGYYVVRVGDIMKKPFDFKHPKVIDYSFSKYKSDFGHLYLGAKCAFIVGTSSGFMSISQIFCRPVCIINYVPIEYLITFSKGVTIWKHHIKDGKRMSVKEIIDSGLGTSTVGSDFTEKGVTLEDNTEQEILDAVMETADLYEGKEGEDQSEFWKAFENSVCPIFGVPLHGEIIVNIGREFLKGYQ